MKIEDIKDGGATFLKLVRIRNCIIVFFAVMIGATLTSGEFSYNLKIILAAFSASVITAAGNTLNDYFDREIDAINKPERPLASGKISINDAMMLVLVLFSMGIALSRYVNSLCLAIAFLNTIVLIIYAKYSKKLLFVSNLIIGYLVGSVFLFGAAAVGKITPTIEVLFLCAFLMTVSREIIKDIEDIKGDQKVQAKTLPIRIGAGKSRMIAALFGVTAVILSVVPWFYSLLNDFYIFIIAIADIIFLFSLTMPPSTSQRTMVFGIVLTLFAFLVGVC